MNPDLLYLATKIVNLVRIGRRWFFVNGRCVAFANAQRPHERAAQARHSRAPRARR